MPANTVPLRMILLNSTRVILPPNRPMERKHPLVLPKSTRLTTMTHTALIQLTKPAILATNKELVKLPPITLTKKTRTIIQHNTMMTISPRLTRLTGLNLTQISTTTMTTLLLPKKTRTKPRKPTTMMTMNLHMLKAKPRPRKPAKKPTNIPMLKTHTTLHLGKR